MGKGVIVVLLVVCGRCMTLISRVALTGMAYYKINANYTVNANIFSDYLNELYIYLKFKMGVEKVLPYWKMRDFIKRMKFKA